MPNDKMYKVGVGIDKKSLDRIRKDLADIIKPFEDAMREIESNGLNAGNKSKAKAELTSIMKLTEKQATALQDMANGVIPSDPKQLNALKQNVQNLVTFMSDAMQRMAKVGASTDWMKNGTSFVDTFIHMKSTLETTGTTIANLQTSIGDLTKSFNVLKDAFAEMHPEAFGKRFGAEVRATTSEIKRAQELIRQLQSQGYKELENSLKIRPKDKKESIYTYAEDDKDTLKESHQWVESAIREHLATIDQLTAKYENKKTPVYANPDYKKAVHGLVVELQNFENIKSHKSFEEAFANTGSGAVSSIKGVTTEIKNATDSAVKQIKDALSGIKGIEVGITIPDANSAEFTSKINQFVQNATTQFKNNPVKLNVELLDPFKNNAGAKLTKHQKKLADQTKEIAKSSGFSDESLLGLDSPDTSRTVRHIIESFQNIQNAVKAGQQSITNATRQWRQEIDKELTLRAKFNNLDIKAEAANLMHELQAFLNENPPLFIDVDVDNFVESLQAALKDIVFSVNVKADNIDSKGAVLNLNGAQLVSGGKIDPVRNDPQATRPPQSEIPAINATKENTEVVTEATRVQNVLKDAIKQLQSSIDANKEAKKISESDNERRIKFALDNQSKINDLRKEINDFISKGEEASDIRSSLRQEIKKIEAQEAADNEQYRARHANFKNIFKNNDTDAIQREFSEAVQFLQSKREEIAQSIEKVKLDDNIKNKGKKVKNLESKLSEIDKLLSVDTDKELVILEAMRRSHAEQLELYRSKIASIEMAIQSQDRKIIAYNENVTYAIGQIDKLSHESEIEDTQRIIQSRESQSTKQQKRIDNINNVLKANQSPVQLVFDEVTKFWKQSYRTIEKTKSELDALKNGKYSDDLKAKLSKLTEDEQKTMIQGLISSKEKRIADWETRQSLMSQKGLGDWSKDVKLEDVLKSFTVESLTDILSRSSTLSDDLLNNSNLKSLSSIKEIAYYAGIAQDALGFKVQTDGEYVDEKTLQAKLMELARIKTFTEKVNGMFPRNNETPELKGVESFIEFFEKLNVTKDTISSIVEQAQGKIGTIRESLIGVPESSTEYQNKQLDINRLQNIINSPISALDAAKEYLASFKNFANTIANDTRFVPGEDGKALSASQMAQVIWDGMDATVRSSVTKVMLASSEFDGVKELNQVSIAGVLDKMVKVFETGALKDITSEDKSYQQLVALLDRQSKFQRVKTVTDLQYSGSVKSSLYDARTPDKPVYVKVVGSHGEESVYDIHKPGKGKADSDRSFSTNPKSLDRLFKHLGITEQVDEIVSAMFNDPTLAQSLMDQMFAEKNISLSTKPFTRTASKAYGFENTPLGKNLNDQKKLAREIEGLEAGKYSQSVLRSIEGLSGEERTVKIQQIIANKKAELESLKQLEFSEEAINQSLVALMNDVEIGKAQEKDARRSMRRNAKMATNLGEDGKSDWIYHTRQNNERAAAKRAADMIRSGTKDSSQNLANPLQQIIDRVQIAGQYGLMDTKEIEQLLAQYDEAYKAARSMPRIKDAGTPISMFDQINAAWEKEEELRNQVFSTFFGSDGWYATQVVTDQMSVIEGELARKEQSIMSSASSNNSAIESQIADINAKEAKAKQDADNYAAKLYDKYLKEPEEEIQAELRRRSAEIEAKARQTQAAKDSLGSLADRDTGLKQLKSDIWNRMQQDSQYVELNQLRRQASVGSQEHKNYTQAIQEIENKYTAEYNQARQAWIDSKATELDAEYEAFVQSIKDSAVGDASKNAVAKFNKDFKGKTTSKRKTSGIEKFIESERQRMYQEAEAAREQALAALDMSGIIPQDIVGKDIENARKEAEAKRKAVLASVKKKSDVELMAQQSYGKAADTASAEVERIHQENQDREILLKTLLAQYNRTKEILNAERGIYESSQATQTAIQQQLGDGDSARIPSGLGTGYLGAIDTSHLATESTLRGIYALLNGGPPEGGWGTSNKNASNASNVVEGEAFVKNMRDVLGKLSHQTENNVETQAFVDNLGRLLSIANGENNRIPMSTWMSALNEASRKSKVSMDLHSHQNGDWAPSERDLSTFMDRAYSLGQFITNDAIKLLGTVGQGTDTGVAIDFSEINQGVANTIRNRCVELYHELVQNNPDFFAFDSEGKLGILKDVINNKDLLNQASQKMFGAIQQAFTEFGYGDAVYKLTPESIGNWTPKIQQAATKVANTIVESGAQAAVEAVNSTNFTKEDIVSKQTVFQEKFKTKELKNGKKGFEIAGASKIDQALYNVGDRLTKESLTDADLGKLSKAYNQLENAFKEDIVNRLDQETVDFLNTLRGQISSVLDANSSRLSAKEQQSKAIADAKKYLSELRTEEGKRVSGTSRASTGIDQIYGILDKGKAELSNNDLTTVAQGYYRLQQTVNHAVFEKLDENTKKVINDAIQEAKAILDKNNVTVKSDELIGTVLDEANAKLFTNANKNDKKKKIGRTISAVTEPQIMKDDKVLAKASVYLDGTTQKQAQEVAAVEAAITQEKQKQNQLATEAVQKEEKQATATQERANAEKKTTENKKAKMLTTTDGAGGYSGSSNQGGFLGALNRIAQEQTLQSIVALLSDGIKTTSGGRESTKKKDGSLITLETAETEALSYIKKNYPDYTKLGDLKPVADGYSIDVFQPRMKEIAATQELINKLEAEGKQNTDQYAQAQSRLNDLKLEQEKITLRINSVDGQTQITEKRALQNLAVGTKAAAKELQLVDNMMMRLHDSGVISVGDDGNITSQNASITNYLKSIQALQDSDGSSEHMLSELTLRTQGYRKEVELLLRAQEQYNVGEKIGVLPGDLGKDYGAIKTAMQGMVAETSKYKATFGALTPVIKNGQVVSYQLAYTLQTGKREVQDMTASLNPLTNELRVQTGAVKNVATGWDKFWAGFKGKFRSITQYLFSMGSIYRVIGVFRQGIQHVKNIDLALTELKKVTDETEASYSRFLDTASKAAGKIGSTVADFVNATADFARLGYSVEQASSLAEAASVYKNVGDGINDISAASESIISTMKAFGIEANDAMGIVDRFNEVGNNFAISSTGIGEAMQRSASALYEAGNTIDESIALITGANSVVQNPEQVGTALKTLALRLRGAKVE